jgi:hypothetical protein
MTNMSIALNLYEIFIHGYPVRKNKKYLLFFSVRVTFFVNCATYKNCYEHSV